MKYDFLILGFGEISAGWTNPQWMAYTLEKQKNKVAYFNPPAYKKIKLNHIYRLIQRLFKSNSNESPHFNIYSSYLNDHQIFRFINYFELKKVNQIIAQSKNIICCQPLWLQFLELPNDKTTFLICDDYSSLNSSSKNQKILDDFVAKNYNKIIITNNSLREKYQKAVFENNCISHFHFDYHDKEILNQKKKNQVCFVGALHSEKIDVELIIDLLKKHPEMDFLFAGKIFNISIDKFSTFRNFKYLGELNFKDATSLMCESKYGLIPFSTNNYTNSVSSMKYFEYLASLTIPICTKIPMYDSLPENLRPNLYLEDELDIKKFQIPDIIEKRKYILNNYTYSSRIERLRNIGFFKN